MPTQLGPDEHLAALLSAGERLRDAAHRAGPAAPVPTCPAWDVRKLVLHTGMVHRWARANLRGEPANKTRHWQDEGAAVPDLLAWFADGVAALVETIRATPDDAKAMVFLKDAPPPRRFWARRQAHETTIHAADAVAAVLGRAPTVDDFPVDPAIAADGIDELLCGFITRGRNKLPLTRPMTIVVSAQDTGHAWTIVAKDNAPLATTIGAADRPDIQLTGTVAQLYLGLWNRGEEVIEQGDADFLSIWRKSIKVRWS
ncbi:MAG TPA: maleylpyruvate isomerase N-terminal domain-containing protein [Natronosporangium sp.]